LGTDLDKATQAQLDRGYRMVEALKQPQFQPMSVVDQVMILYAGTRGHLDKVERGQVRAWEQQFLHFMAEQRPQVRATVTDMKRWKRGADGKPLHEGLEEAIAAFQPQFKGQAGEPGVQ